MLAVCFVTLALVGTEALISEISQPEIFQFILQGKVNIFLSIETCLINFNVCHFFSMNKHIFQILRVYRKFDKTLLMLHVSLNFFDFRIWSSFLCFKRKCT